MADREATDAEMLAAVERWARARLLWVSAEILPRRRGQWLVAPRDSGGFGIFCGRDAPDPLESWVVDPHTALLWACTVETTETLTSPSMPSEADARAWAAARVMSGRMEILRQSGVSARRPGEPREFVARVTRPLAVDVGKCPACVKRCGRFEWAQAVGVAETGLLNVFASRHAVRDGWTVGAFRAELVAGNPVSTVAATDRRGFMLVCVATRPCPDCNGTGRDIREVARLVLDLAEAVSEWARYGAHVLAWMYFDDGWAWREEGMPARLYDLRDALHVAADQLQVSGEHLGTWHALGLAGKDEAAAEMAAWLKERAPGRVVMLSTPPAQHWARGGH